MGVKDSISTGALWTLWLIGVCAGLLAVSGTIPPRFVWLAATMLPLPVVTFLLLSKDIVLELLTDWDFYIITLLQLVMAIHAANEIHDKRSFFWAFCLPTLGVAPLTDAYPGKYRPLFVQLYFSGLFTIFVAWNALLVFHFHKGHHLLMLIGDNVTLALFYIRPFWTALMHPNQLVLIRSVMCTAKEQISDETGSKTDEPYQRRILRTASGERRSTRVRLARGSTSNFGATDTAA